MEPIFWKKLPCLKEQKWEKWLEKLVQSMKAWPPHLALLTCLILCEGHHLFGKLGIWESSLMPTSNIEPVAFTFPMTFTSPCFSLSSSPLPLPKPPSSLPRTTLTASSNSQPFLAPCPLRASTMITAKDKSDCATFTLTPTFTRNAAKTQPKPGWFNPLWRPLKPSPLFSGCQSHWWFFVLQTYCAPWVWTILPFSLLGEL